MTDDVQGSTRREGQGHPLSETRAILLIGSIHADGLGSIRRLTDEAGNITDGYTYSAFGELLSHTGPDEQPYTFAGEPFDPNSGFSYNRARWYDSRVGRFVGMDALAGAGQHPYSYASNDPLDKVDPTGLFGEEFSFALSMMGTINAIAAPNFLAATRAAGGKCGPDITNLLKDVVDRIRTAWSAKYSQWVKVQKCAALLSLGGWDITELGGYRPMWNTYCPGCPTSTCKDSVEVQGKCYYSGAVNYVMFGLGCSLCKFPSALAVSTAGTYRAGAGVYYGEPLRSVQAVDWTNAGYYGWPNFQAPSSPGEFAHCQTGQCCTATHGKYSSHLEFLWQPLQPGEPY